MQNINYHEWKRREQYEFFVGMDCPYFSLTTDLDITKTRAYMKENQIPSYLGMIYIVSRALNLVEEFRVRLNLHCDPPEVLLYDIVHPSYAVLIKNSDKLNFCRGIFDPDSMEFLTTNKALMKKAETETNLELDPNRDDLIYISCLPWIHFKSISHPINYNPADFFPRITWGRFVEQGSKVIMALNVNVHHGLIDGLHVSHFIDNLIDLIKSPENVFS
ncbi:CatA-like O-acetyltransferase [Desulfonatronovibrio magnus]|uniref:CatA-like O-acetyltransferase n=1 Tax=Desulfonatronovibrio magnus TaxID=698827 RepID=UPI0005EAD323|nr:CatA-like O-acetyltransferase [Desulfonatronovibrio magnus]